MTPPFVPPPKRLAFGPFVLEPETGRLFRDDHVVPLAPKPFETLLYLARRAATTSTPVAATSAAWSC